MIEDKELGLKIAEDSDEAIWARIKKNSEKEIKNNEVEIIINTHILQLANSMLSKNGTDTKPNYAG